MGNLRIGNKCNSVCGAKNTTKYISEIVCCVELPEALKLSSSKLFQTYIIVLLPGRNGKINERNFGL